MKRAKELVDRNDKLGSLSLSYSIKEAVQDYHWISILFYHTFSLHLSRNLFLKPLPKLCLMAICYYIYASTSQYKPFINIKQRVFCINFYTDKYLFCRQKNIQNVFFFLMQYIHESMQSALSLTQYIVCPSVSQQQ